MENLTILVPVYNEEKSIRNTIDTLKKIIDQKNWEIITVNDGSTDETTNILSAISGIKVINHRINKGYGASLKTGLRHAKYNNVCITDADNTYPNDRIPELYEKYLEDNLDMLVGARNGANVKYSFIRKIPKFFIIKLANYISGRKIPDINSGLRIFKKDIALRFFNLYPSGFSFTTTITMAFLCRDYDVEYISIDYFDREGTSKISPVKDTVGFFNLLSKIAVFYNPMKFFLPFVGLLTVISFAAIYRDIFLNQNLSQSSVLFPVLAVLIFFMGLIADMISKK